MEQKVDFQKAFESSNTNSTLLNGYIDTKDAPLSSPHQSNTLSNVGIDLFLSKTERNLHNFWRQIDSTYFKTIKEDNLTQIESLISHLHQDPIDTGPPKRINTRNTILYQEKVEQTTSEEPWFDGHLQSNPQDDFDDDTSELGQELRNITESQHIMHIENVQRLLELKDKLMNFREDLEYVHKSPSSDLADGGGYIYADKPSRKELSSTEMNMIQLEYLRKMIINLEERQIAESIKYVIDCRKDTDKQSYQFCVIFDDAVCETEVWIDEETLDRFDSLREHSLFKICHIPQKIQSSLNAYNISAYSQCRQKLIHRTLDIKERPWKNIIKQTLGDTSTHVFKSYYKENMISKAKELSMCHQCEYLFPDEFLVKCNYRSSKMGLFTADRPSLKTSTLSNEGIISRRLPYRYKWKEVEEEYVCQHKYCRNCLKSHYDLNYQDIIYQPNWLCPFCQGICFCSRCTRNDHVNQLTNLYINMKGDLSILANSSPLQKYMWNSTKRATKIPHNQIIVIPRPGNLPKSKNSSKKSLNTRTDSDSSIEPTIQKKLKASTDEIQAIISHPHPQARLKIRASSGLGPEGYQSQEEIVPGSKKRYYKAIDLSLYKGTTIEVETERKNSKGMTILKGGLLNYKESPSKQESLVPGAFQKFNRKEEQMDGLSFVQKNKVKNKDIMMNGAKKNYEEKVHENGKQAL